MTYLPSFDEIFLASSGLDFEPAVVESGMTCIVFPSWPLPAGLNQPSADLLVRLPGGYPDAAPDMWWFSPAITAVDGRIIQATEYSEAYVGRTWQRWSRHLNPGQWQSGIDGLENYLALIRDETERAAKPVNS